ncbi:MAG: translocation/assembly module TamB domain-containing protein [Cyclobacteriaceae bacterium]
MTRIKHIIRKIFKILGWVFLAVLTLVIILLLFIRSPWGQDMVIQKATSYVANNTQSTVSIERLFITFSGNVYIEGLYLEDQKGDTLIYSKNLETGINPFPLIRKGNIVISRVEWEGLVANVERGDDGKFNFDFLIEAFASGNEPGNAQAKSPSDPPKDEGGMPEISIGPVRFTGFDLKYKDQKMGLDAKFRLGELELDLGNMDLDRMEFHIKHFYFADSELDYVQSQPFPPSEDTDTTDSVLPLVLIDDFTIEKVKASYQSIPDGIDAEMALGMFFISLPEADLEKQKILVKEILLNDSEMIYHSTKAGASDQAEEVESSTPSPFTWPDWILEVGQIHMENNHFMLTTGGEMPGNGVFNPDAIALEEVSMEIRNFFLREQKAGMDLDQLSFVEASGFRLDQFSYSFAIDNTTADIQDLVLEAGISKLEGGLQLGYPEIQALIDHPEMVNFSLDFPGLNINSSDAYYFSPELKENAYMDALAEKSIVAHIQAQGTMADLNLKDVQVNWGQATEMKLQGNLSNLSDPGALDWDIETFEFRTIRSDVLAFVSENDLGVKLPEEINGVIQSQGNLNALSASAEVDLSGAQINMKGNFEQTEFLAFDLDLNVNELPLGEILQNPDLGMVSFHMESKGRGEGLSDLNARLVSDFRKLELYDYDYAGMEFSGNLKNGEGEIEMAFQDDNLDLNLLAQIALDTLNSKVEANIDLEGADLQALHLSPDDLRASFEMILDWEGTPENFRLDSELREGMIVFEERAYPIGDFNLQMDIRPDSTGMQLNSAIFDALLASNSTPNATISGLKRHFNRYFEKNPDGGDDNYEPVELRFDMDIQSSALLDQVLLPDLEQLDQAKIKIGFSESEKDLNVDVDFPFIAYAGLEVDSLGLRVRSDEEDFSFAFGLVSLETGPLSLARTYFTGEVDEKKLYMDFNAREDEETLVHVAFDLLFEGDTTQLHVDPENVVLNKQVWEIPDENQIQYAERHLHFDNFDLTRNNQSLTFSNAVEGTTAPHIGVAFREFRLSTFTSLLNPDELIASGLVNGEFILEYPFDASGIVARMQVADLNILEVPLGNLALTAQSAGEGDYDFNLALKEGGVDLDLIGEYVANVKGADLNLDLDLNEVQLKVIEGITDGAISEAQGNISGNFTVQGTTVEPLYNGSFQFNQTEFTIATLNSRFKLAEEEINLDNVGIYLDNFTINDQDNNTFSIDGEILTDSISNPTFNLQMDAENFLVLNSSREDNDLFYGKANIDAAVKIQGDLNLPRINAKIGVNRGTDLTFIVPESQLDVVEREGVVRFVNREDPDDILTRRENEISATGFTGYQVAALLDVSPDAIFNVVVDERSGDNLQIAGEADLKLNLDPNGRVTLAGRYELEKGHYEMSLYGVVSRRFEIEEGSTLNWGGDPMDANLDITAIYRVETSAAELMAASAAGGSRENMNKYRQELPFLVFLDINGELLKPEISFRLDMPEEQRGAIGGTVYSQVQQLNGQEGELNRQVFSLLVLNRFFPDSGAEGGGGGTTTMAKSSVSQMLSGQLNSLSDNLLGDSGFEVDLDLDSFRDYQGSSPQDRTQLNVNARKRFIDDRLIVQVGSQIDIEGSSPTQETGNSMLGNVSVEYLLTKNGRYRLRAFRKNQFESIIDGQLLVTGLSLIFNRDFNRFRELWRGTETKRNGGLPSDEDENVANRKVQSKKESEGNEE